MPIYEYQCINLACGHTISQIENMNICDIGKKCPKCGKPMHKIMSSPGRLVIK